MGRKFWLSVFNNFLSMLVLQHSYWWLKIIEYNNSPILIFGPYSKIPSTLFSSSLKSPASSLTYEIVAYEINVHVWMNSNHVKLADTQMQINDALRIICRSVDSIPLRFYQAFLKVATLAHFSSYNYYSTM